MTNLGLPVPPGFIITTEACRAYLRSGSTPRELLDEVRSRLDALEHEMGRTLGDSPIPCCCRCGPGEVLDARDDGDGPEHRAQRRVRARPGRAVGNERFAWDSYRRLIQMFGKTVLDLDGDLFADALHEVMIETGVESDVEIPAEALKGLVLRYEEIMTSHGAHFPQDPANSCSVRSRRCSVPGTPARPVVPPPGAHPQRPGHRGQRAGDGLRQLRRALRHRRGVHPRPGHRRPGVRRLPESAQGEDVVSGIRNTLALSDLERLEPGPYAELMDIMHTLEQHYRDLCDIEFTIERGKLWMLQTRVGKRTAGAAFRIATQLVEEDLIDMDEAVRRVSGPQLAQLMFPQFDRSNSQKPSTRAPLPPRRSRRRGRLQLRGRGGRRC